MRFEQEWDTFNGGGVRALPALRQALFDQGTNVRERADAAAGVALAAKIVAEPLAVGGLREHARERELSDPSRAGEEHGMWDAFAREHAAQRGYGSLVPNELRKTHKGLPRLTVRPAHGKECAIPRYGAPPDGSPQAKTKRRIPCSYSRCVPSSVRLPGGRKARQFARDGRRPLHGYRAEVKCRHEEPSSRPGGAPPPLASANTRPGLRQAGRKDHIR